jgi:hypothetical protein
MKRLAASMATAAVPATAGEAKEVPERTEYEVSDFESASHRSEPKDTASGFT